MELMLLKAHLYLETPTLPIAYLSEVSNICFFSLTKVLIKFSEVKMYINYFHIILHKINVNGNVLFFLHAHIIIWSIFGAFLDSLYNIYLGFPVLGAHIFTNNISFY